MSLCCVLTTGSSIQYIETSIRVTAENTVCCEIDDHLHHFSGADLFQALQSAQDAIDAAHNRVSLLFYNPKTRRFLGDVPCPTNSKIECANIDERLDPYFKLHTDYKCFFRAGTELLSEEDLTQRMLSTTALTQIAFELGMGSFSESANGDWVSIDVVLDKEDADRLVMEKIRSTTLDDKLAICNKHDSLGEYYPSWCEGKIVRFSLLG